MLADAAIIRSVAAAIPRLNEQAAPSDWPVVSLGAFTVQLPPDAQDVKRFSAASDAVLTRYEKEMLYLGQSRASYGVCSLQRVHEFPRFLHELDGVDLLAACYSYQEDPAHSFRGTRLAREFLRSHAELSDRKFASIAVFRSNDDDVKGLVRYAGSAATIMFWTQNESVGGHIIVSAMEADSCQTLTARIVSSLRRASDRNATSQPVDGFLRDCRETLVTRKRK